MESEMRKDLERYGWIIDDEATWVWPWVPYWRLIVNKGTDAEALCEELSTRYPHYRFGTGETHINNIIYTTVIIGKKSEL